MKEGVTYIRRTSKCSSAFMYAQEFMGKFEFAKPTTEHLAKQIVDEEQERGHSRDGGQ
jgi:hypothetical protein